MYLCKMLNVFSLTALNDNVHRLQEDFGRFLSTHIEPKDNSCCQATINEWEYKIRNRIETLVGRESFFCSFTIVFFLFVINLTADCVLLRN